ncbi:MAG: serine hydrolase domain-containing protein [Ilumatobacteraceae bacterium]
MSSERVGAVLDRLFGRSADLGASLAAVVVHRGELVTERYGTRPANAFAPAEAIGPDTTLISWSTAKSMTHAAVGILVRAGLLDLDMPAPVAEWSGTERAPITLLDLLEMRSGLRFVEDYVDGDVSHCIAMLFGEGSSDHAAYAASLPLDHEPGTVWSYSSGTTNIIARVIGDVLTGSSGRRATAHERRSTVESFLRDRLFGPIGMASATPSFDAAGNWVGSSYVDATARDFAAFGEFYRNDGVTRAGERLLPVGWADHGRTEVAVDDSSVDDGVGGFGYGRHWWTWRRYPGSMAAHGYEGQYVVVVPDRDLVVVHLGTTPAEHRPIVVQAIAEIVDAYAPLVGPDDRDPHG